MWRFFSEQCDEVLADSIKLLTHLWDVGEKHSQILSSVKMDSKTSAMFPDLYKEVYLSDWAQ